MRKIIAVILIIGISVCFAACKNDDPDESDLPSLIQTNPTESADITDVSNSTAPSTMILTTRAGETAPQVSTTEFVPDVAALTVITSATSAAPTTDISFVVPTDLSVPSVVTSRAPTTFPTLPPTTASTTSPTVSSGSTTRPTTTEPTTTRNRNSKAVYINDIATTSDKKMIVTLDSSGWSDKFKTNSQNITVKIDGTDFSAPCSVKSGAKNPDGYQYITIDLSKLTLSDGAKVQFTVPTAFLQTSDGEQYNSAFSGSYTIM